MTLYLTGPSPEHLIHNANHELDILYHWCLCNRLTINTDKTHFMLFTTKNKINLPQLHINRKPISKTDEIKFLGIFYDDCLTFKRHIHNLTLKISRHIALLYQLKDLTTPEVLKTVFYAHIYPLLNYCNPIWCITYPTYLIPLKLQLKKIVRIITNTNYLAHTDPIFQQTRILKLDDVTKLAIATYMYENKNHLHTLLPSHQYNILCYKP